MSSFEEKLKKHKSFCCWTGLGIISHIKARVILLFPLSHKPMLSRLVASDGFRNFSRNGQYLKCLKLKK